MPHEVMVDEAGQARQEQLAGTMPRSAWWVSFRQGGGSWSAHSEQKAIGHPVPASSPAALTSSARRRLVPPADHPRSASPQVSAIACSPLSIRKALSRTFRAMRPMELLPAAMLAGIVTVILCGVQLLPSGRTMLLVRVPVGGPRAALVAAAAADAALVSIPAPGFAVLYGDASHVRAALGLVIAWKGRASCSPDV